MCPFSEVCNRNVFFVASVVHYKLSLLQLCDTSHGRIIHRAQRHVVNKLHTQVLVKYRDRLAAVAEWMASSTSVPALAAA